LFRQILEICVRGANGYCSRKVPA
jgi:hypothetical protein